MSKRMRSPRGMAEIGPPRKGKAKPVFREVAPGKWVAHGGPDPEAEIRDSIKLMRRDARQTIIASGNNPKQTAQIILDKENVGLCDGAYFAAILHEQLVRAENCLRVLLACPVEDARWQGLRLAKEMDTSRFYWRQLGLVGDEKFTKAGERTSEGGKESNKEKQRAARRKAEQVRAYFAGKSIPRGQMEAVVREAMTKYGLSRSQIFAIKKAVQ